MSFSFNFRVSESESDNPTSNGSSEVVAVTAKKKKQQKRSRKSSFEWLYKEDNSDSVSFLDSLLQNDSPDNEIISIAESKHLRGNDGIFVYDDDDGKKKNDYLLRVREESASFRNKNTDLVPGVYEGGLKVWECSIDLCRFFHSQSIDIHGYILEIGAGHGLPGIWALKHAISKSQNYNTQNANASRDSDCFIAFSDYNDFVVRDVTMQNVAINVKDAYSKTENQPQKIAHWLKEHVAFGAGDWLAMSDDLLCEDPKQPKPPAIPQNGLFDYILASETNYSKESTRETAELLIKHLKPGTGVAYISTKRYYFGVGGGTRCFCAALQNNYTHKFHIETLEVYDNGVGNIRELLLIKSLHLED